MADPAVATPVVADPTAPTPTPAAAPVKLAGKFDTPAALEDGFRNLRVARLGLDPFNDGTVLVGEKGLYANHEALATAYKDMERIAGKLPASKDNGLGIPTDKPAVDPNAGVEALLQHVGVDAEELTETWQKSGKLTEKQYAAFAGKGYPKAVIDGYMAGMAAIATQTAAKQQAAIAEAETIAGGAEKLATLRNWAGQNMPKERLAALNDMVERNPAFYPEMVRLISDAHRAAVGAGGSAPLVNGQPAAGGPAITSVADLIALQNKANAGDAAAKEQLRRVNPRDLDRFVS